MKALGLASAWLGALASTVLLGVVLLALPLTKWWSISLAVPIACLAWSLLLALVATMRVVFRRALVVEAER